MLSPLRIPWNSPGFTIIFFGQNSHGVWQNSRHFHVYPKASWVPWLWEQIHCLYSTIKNFLEEHMVRAEQNCEEWETTCLWSREQSSGHISSRVWGAEANTQDKVLLLSPMFPVALFIGASSQKTWVVHSDTFIIMLWVHQLKLILDWSPTILCPLLWPVPFLLLLHPGSRYLAGGMTWTGNYAGYKHLVRFSRCVLNPSRPIGSAAALRWGRRHTSPSP